MRTLRTVILTSILSLGLPLVALAHGVGQVYNLPIPLKYYLGSAGIAVAFSFFVFAFLTDGKPEAREARSFSFGSMGLWLNVLKIISVLLFFLTVTAGIFGNQNSAENIAPVFFWIYFIIGIGTLSIIIGNIWDVLNPWKIICNALGIKPQNKKISAWVGVVLVLGLYWLELCSGQSFVPQVIGGILLIYTLINLLFAYQFENWFESGELFSVLFGFIGSMAYLRVSPDEKSLIYAPLTDRLSARSTWATLGLASVLLAGTSFDSFKETVTWFRMLGSFGHTANLVLSNTVGLILFPLPFVLLYLFLMWIMQKTTKTSDFKTLALKFVWSLAPIAFGYTLAHNFSLFVVTLPQFWKILSDPFGLGWNLIHTAATNYKLIMGARSVWFTEISLVVIAHVVATYFAHKIATKQFQSVRQVIISQFPTLVLMVAFTVTTLWLLSQPLVISK